MSAKLVRAGGRLKAIGLPEGTLIQIIEGFVQTYNEVLRVGDSKRSKGAEGFTVLERFGEPPPGVGVFRVRDDGTLHCLSENYCAAF